MSIFKSSVDKNSFKVLFSVIFILLLVQFFLGGFLMYHIVRKETVDQLTVITKRVKEDITFKNGKWDTSRYNADPDLPGTYPLYVLATDGFVIDRWKPLHGFLDTSDAKKLLSYQSPQTVSTDTNQSWQILSRPLFEKDQHVGVLTVAYFNPQHDQIETINTQLADTAQLIQSKISIANGSISTKNLDARDIPYDIVFQIVDRYNNIITKTDNTNSIDRIPNFIDTSYIGDILQGQQVQQVADIRSGETFIVYTQPILNDQNTVIGVIVAGKSITFLWTILRDYYLIEGLLVLLLSSIAFLFVAKLTPSNKQQEFRTIAFDKKSAILSLDTLHIQLPYATNQYYLCEALFSAPKKRWESDELLEKFGDTESTHWRKVYDAMLMVNKKVMPILQTRLIILTNKTYQINQRLLEKVM